jgi:WXG100 family type VII secretion target
MNDDYIHVNYGQVNDAYDALQYANQSIGKVVGQLEHVVGALVGSWQGISQEVWTQIQARWSADMADMSTQLAKSAGVLDEMAVNYANTDNNLALQWQAIT